MSWLSYFADKLLAFNVWRCYLCGHEFRTRHADAELANDFADRQSPRRCPKCRMKYSYVIKRAK